MKNLVNPSAFAELEALHDRFRDADPFPHLVIDDFLNADVAESIHAEVRRTDCAVNASNDITQKKKVACNDWTKFDDVTGSLIAYFNSWEFIRPLETIAGIDGLFGDPFLEGGGIHQTSNGGFLKMHTDFNWNAKLRADRRINTLLYLNKDWKPEHRGELILQKVGGESKATVEPIFNRLVVFNTNDKTLHGHPAPLDFPEGYSRASIAMYYYSTGIPVDERTRGKSTTTRYVPLHAGDIDLANGSLRAKLGYLMRRYTSL